MEPIGGEVERTLRRLGPQGAMADVVARWRPTVGDAIARNAWPARIGRDGTLHVATSSSAWAFELAQLAPAMLERLRDTLGEASPRALRFAPGPLPEPEPAVEEGVPARPAPGPRERAAADALVAALDNAELRALVARAAAASLARGGSDRPL